MKKEKKGEEWKKWRHWLKAARPKTLTASFVPILCSSTFAFKKTDHFYFFLFFCTMASALCLQVATNLFNDALDFLKGVDVSARRLGPPRVTAQKIFSSKKVLNMGLLFAFLACLFGLPLVLKGGIPILILGLISLALAYLYTGGPFPLAYFALGDIFVLIFFGWILTGGTYFLQTEQINFYVFLLGTQIGLLATSLIAINNLRDHQSDKEGGKRTLATLMGVQASRWEIAFCLLFPYIINGFVWGFQKKLWAAGLLPFLCLPLALHILKHLFKEPPGTSYNKLLAQSAQHQLFFGFLLSFGMLLP